jgi:cytochrome c553
MRIDATLACAAFSLCLGAWPVYARDVTTSRVTAAGIANAGNGHGSPACSSCHGANGEGNPLAGFPRLAGLPAGYIERQLENFASGKRANAIMMPIARTLCVGERQVIANYYAKLATQSNHEPAQSTSPNAASLMPGETLAVRGRWGEDLPACSQCHGSGGQGVGDTFPPLTGQPTLYIENQLRAWQSGTRDPGPMGLMGRIAKKLTADDVKTVAAYLGALPLRNGAASP